MKLNITFAGVIFSLFALTSFSYAGLFTFMGGIDNDCSDEFNRSVCVDGYEKIDCECVKECEFGSVRNEYGYCEDVLVPKNAELTEDGRNWKCSNNYELFNDECIDACESWEYRDDYGNCKEIFFTNIPENTYPSPIQGKCAKGYVYKETGFKIFKNAWCEPLKGYNEAILVDVELDYNSPQGELFPGEKDIILARFLFNNNNSVPVNIKTIELSRIGVSADSTVKDVYLSNNNIKLTDLASFEEGKILFNNQDGIFTIPANNSVLVLVKSDIDVDTQGQLIGVSISNINFDGIISESKTPIKSYIQKIETQQNNLQSDLTEQKIQEEKSNLNGLTREELIQILIKLITLLGGK